MSTIAAISTAKGVGGIGVIRISGEDAIKIASKVFVPFNASSSVLDMRGYSAKYGKILSGGQPIDEAVLLVFRAPNSYTGENVAEISCHGGLYITREVLRTVLEAGAVLAQPGEFTKRAFLNGKIDLSQAESVMDIISSKSERASTIAFNQKEGMLSKKINEIKDNLLSLSASLAVWADYPEEDIPEINVDTIEKSLKGVISEISSMVNSYNTVLKDGVKTVIIGKPNVGKSSIMNLFSGTDKSIVTDIAGTTRDMVEEMVVVGDIPLLLIDTAGIRDTEDIVEKIGVDRAKKSISDSDLTLLILDASSDLTRQDKEILNLCNKKNTIIILNKIDLGIKIDKNSLSTFSDNIVEMSAINLQGKDEFKKMLEKMVGISDLDPSEVFISNERQLFSLKKSLEILNKALEDLKKGVTLDAVTVLIQSGVESLMQLTGENVNIETVNKIFSKFCVGK